MSERWRERLPDASVGAAVFVIGLLELATQAFAYPGEGHLLVVLGFAVACGLSRRLPAAALAIVWVVCALQLLVGTPILVTQFSVAIVAFGCARWGRVGTVVLSGLSIPAAGLMGLLVVAQDRGGIFRGYSLFQEIRDNAYRFSDQLLVGAAILGLLILAVPWLAGLVLRATARAQRSEVRQEEAEVAAVQAHEIARLRDEQATLARDVHDVVGHSLAVILAQAESGQYLPDDDPAALKKTLATIATSARSSLQDVRHVLSGAPDAPPTTDAYEELLDGVRAGGAEVAAVEVGTPQPLPPELEVVAHRVVQEMLTNALKHGRRGRPVRVERHWPEGTWDRDLRIEVRNVADRADDETQPLQAGGAPPGQGLDGMRRRLEAVGGRLDVRRRDEDGEPTFTATAWVPVSGR